MESSSLSTGINSADRYATQELNCENSSNNELPVLCLDDVTKDFPSTFIKFLSSIPDDTLHTHTFTRAIVYTLAVEIGFYCDCEYSQPLSERTYSFKKWKLDSLIWNDKIFTCNDEFRVYLYLGSAPQFSSVLMMNSFCNSDQVLVNFYSTNLDSPVSFCRVIPLLQSNLDRNVMKNICILLKNTLFYPIKIKMLREKGIRIPFLLDLPIEILTYIMHMIDFKDFIYLCSTCIYLYQNFSSCEEIWKHFCLKNFNFVEVSSDWKSQFQKLFKGECIRKRQQANSSQCGQMYRVFFYNY